MGQKIQEWSDLPPFGQCPKDNETFLSMPSLRVLFSMFDNSIDWVFRMGINLMRRKKSRISIFGWVLGSHHLWVQSRWRNLLLKYIFSQGRIKDFVYLYSFPSSCERGRYCWNSWKARRNQGAARRICLRFHQRTLIKKCACIFLQFVIIGPRSSHHCIVLLCQSVPFVNSCQSCQTKPS